MAFRTINTFQPHPGAVAPPHPLEATVSRLEHRVEDLQLFALYTAHEIKNPLRALTLAAETLLADVASGESDLGADGVVERLSDIGAEARRLSAQVSDLVAVVAQAERPLQVVPVNVDHLVAHVLEAFASDFAEISANITVASRLPVVAADEAMLRTVLTNLISNALRYRSPDRPFTLTIEGAQADGTSCQILVTDNGLGIHASDHTRIFAPLGRVHHNEPGYGLGLALARRIVERLGGQIGVHSQLEAGASFWVRLPSATLN